MPSQLCRLRALCTVHCMALRAALLLRASARTLFLRFFWKTAEIAPVRRHERTERLITHLLGRARSCPYSSIIFAFKKKVFPTPRAAAMCGSVLCARSSTYSQRCAASIVNEVWGRGLPNIILFQRQPAIHKPNPSPPEIIWKVVSCRQTRCVRTYGPPCTHRRISY